MLKKMPELNRFKHTKNLYRGQVIIGENGGGDSWPVNARIWREPHEKTWRWSYKCEGELHSPAGKQYDPKSGEGEGCPSVAEAYKALEEAIAKDYA